jgi:hypothetical protein
MTHPKYTAKYLLKKGISYCKQIAKKLGIAPEGDKRQLFTWVEAIIEHQSTQVQKIEIVEATINFNSESWDSEAYEVIVNSEVVHQCSSYQLAERYCKWQGYILVDSQALAQNELEVELEVQAAEASEISFISSDDFFNFEAIVHNDVHNVIATIERDSDNGEWIARMGEGSFSFDSYVDAEQYIKDEYVGMIEDERGSGRITPPIGDMGMTIEDSNFIHDFGQSYTLRVHGALAGDIFLDDDHGWTMNGEDFSQDWQPVAKELIRLTRREYEHLLAA